MNSLCGGIEKGTSMATGSRDHSRTSQQASAGRSLVWAWRATGKPLLRIGSAAATCAILVVASATLVDRPVATWVHEHLGDARFGWFTGNYGGYLLTLGPFSLMAAPAQALESLAVFVFAVLAVAASTGWRPGIRARIILALCLAVFVVTGITSVAKAVFGRTWPESWLGESSGPHWLQSSLSA